MKKLITFIIAGAMMISALPTSVRAGSTTVNGDRETSITPTVRTNVNGATDEVDGDASGVVMSVTIAWDNIDFVYNATTKWNPDTDQYDVTGEWDHDATITITNNSNCKIYARVSFDKTNNEAAYSNVDVLFKNKDKTDSGEIVNACIDSAVGESVHNLDFYMSVYGKPNTLESISSANLGNITVNITGAETEAVTGVTYTSYTTGGSQDGNDNDG